MLKINGTPYEWKNFPDGTPALRAEPQKGVVTLTWLFESNEEMAVLYFLTKHLKEKGAAELQLYLPYVPNARMDRVQNADEVFTLKYFAEWINNLGFGKVYIKDVHSGVAAALIDRAEALPVKPQLEALAGRLLGPQDLLFFPDEGARKRYGSIGTGPTAFGIKTRDWRSGEIQGMDVVGELPESPFNALIVDDICSFGGTFYEAAKRLKELGAQRIWLYVSHCENNVHRGRMAESGLIEKVFTTGSIYTENQDFVEVLKEEIQ